MAKKIIWGMVFMLVAAILQSTVLSQLRLHVYAAPDIILCILVFIAYVNGVMVGQVTGFFSGFALDFLSASPLGFHAFIFTLIGALAGFLHGAFFLDLFFLPIALCVGATIFKAGVYFFFGLLFPDDIPSYSIVSLAFFVEMGMNALVAPFLFMFLKLFGFLSPGQREVV